MGRTAVFLDRDGTVIVDRHYLADPAGVQLLEGAAEAIARLNRSGLPVILVTNQSGIGRGLFTAADFAAVQSRIEDELARAGAHFDAVYHCPHAPNQDCACRKPAPGMFERAAIEHELDLARSWYVGDRWRDVEAGVRAGGTAILLPGEEEGADFRAPRGSNVHRASSLSAAVERVLAQHPGD